jgi:hypothetical protein
VAFASYLRDLYLLLLPARTGHPGYKLFKL